MKKDLEDMKKGEKQMTNEERKEKMMIATSIIDEVIEDVKNASFETLINLIELPLKIKEDATENEILVAEHLHEIAFKILGEKRGNGFLTGVQISKVDSVIMNLFLDSLKMS